VIHLVSIQDKSLYGEPDIAIAVVDAADVEAARRVADDTILELAEKGRGRCVPHAREVDLGRFYRLSSVVRPSPSDRDAPVLTIEQIAMELYEEWARLAPFASQSNLPAWERLGPNSQSQWIAIANMAVRFR
jgi:hypothetical protein